ncbi:hypothetical protein, partial [Pseudomonas syringae]|uniref:hypothetical protein n=1 Tax=Pseudomonas syringae TaxID=317 RepID=UPI0034D6584E
FPTKEKERKDVLSKAFMARITGLLLSFPGGIALQPGKRTATQKGKTFQNSTTNHVTCSVN